MKIPSKVKIGGHIFKVVLEKFKDQQDMGSCDTGKNLIVIDANMPKDQKESTFIHEAMHAMNTTLSGGMGHVVLDSLAEQMYQFLSDNNLLK